MTGKMSDTDFTVDTDETDETEEETPSGYVIRVNNEVVWSSNSEAMLVDEVRIFNARGEVTKIGSHNGDEYLDIQVHVRSYDAPDTYLDMIESHKAQERRDKYEIPLSERPPAEPENDSDHATSPEHQRMKEESREEKKEDGLVLAPEETPESQEDQDKKKEAAGDLEF
jgi:hypothetical protein